METPHLKELPPGIPGIPGAPSHQQQQWGVIISIVIIVLMIVIGAFYSWGKRISQENVHATPSAQSN
jgi:hypothetical protein